MPPKDNNADPTTTPVAQETSSNAFLLVGLGFWGELLGAVVRPRGW